MIRHCVMLRLRRDHDPAELRAVMRGLGTLVGRIDGFEGFSHGPNLDAEGKSPDYPHGFICDLADRDALDRYAADAGHRALGARLVALCAGGAAGIVVYDLETGEDPGMAT
jgi:hypothetical protein